MRHVPWRTGWLAVLALLVAIALGGLAAGNLGYPGIWYDEAAQIWIAQGLHQYSPVHAAPGDWRAVLRANQFANLDPGGYSLLLHAWTRVDRGLVWLRLSALLFHLLATLALVGLAWELTASLPAALGAAFLPLAYGQVLYFAVEIRAYSMEVAGVLVAGYLLHRAIRVPTVDRHLTLGLALALFLWSRYSFVVVAGSVLAALLAARAWRVDRPTAALANLAAAVLPVLYSGVTVYRVALSHHLRWGMGRRGEGPSWIAGPDAGFQAPDYVRRWVLRGQSADVVLATLQENLLSPPALPLTLALGALLLWPLVRRRAALASWPGIRSAPAVAAAALVAQTLSLGLSAGGYYPWHLGQRFSLYLHGVSMLCLLFLLAAGVWALRGVRGAPLVALAVAATLGAGLLAVRGATFRHRHPADLGPALTHLNATPLQEGSVFVSHYEIPALRYLYELGPFREVSHYPAAFRFEQRAEAAREAPIDAAAECLDYVLSAGPVERLVPRFPGHRLAQVPGPTPGHLLRVEPGGSRSPACAATARPPTARAPG